jgi:hypothetical protein
MRKRRVGSMTELRRPYEEVYSHLEWLENKLTQAEQVEAAVIEGERRLDRLDRENQRYREALEDIANSDYEGRKLWEHNRAADVLTEDAS